MTGAAGLPGVAALTLGLFLFAIALIAARWRRPTESGGRRDATSMLGIAVQSLAFVISGVGPTRLTLDPIGATALAAAAVTAMLLAIALALFVWSTAMMGRNWSLIARTRADHTLVTAGPSPGCGIRSTPRWRWSSSRSPSRSATCRG